jgi:hypothetical protein
VGPLLGDCEGCLDAISVGLRDGEEDFVGLSDGADEGTSVGP